MYYNRIATILCTIMNDALQLRAKINNILQLYYVL